MFVILLPLLYLATVASALAFLFSFAKDKKRISNAFYLMAFFVFLLISIGKTFALLLPNVMAIIFNIVLFLVIAVYLTLAVFLIVNSKKIQKSYGASLDNKLSAYMGFIMLAYAVVSLLYFWQLAYLQINSHFLAKIIYISYLILTVVVFILGFIFCALTVYALLYLALPVNKKDYDFIIIHGSGLVHGNQVSKLLEARIQKAIQAFFEAKKPAVKIIASGGQGKDEEITEAQAIYNYLVAAGIDQEKIIIEENSKSTYQNLLFSKEIAKQKLSHPKYLFVTSNYHVLRTIMYAGILQMRGTAIGAKTAKKYLPTAFVREYLAIIKYLRKYLLILFALAFLVLFIVTK